MWEIAGCLAELPPQSMSVEEMVTQRWLSLDQGELVTYSQALMMREWTRFEARAAPI